MNDNLEVNSNGYRLNAGIFIPVEQKDNQDVIIYCPGYPGNIQTSRKISESFCQRGFASIYFDYKGIRDSEGKLDFISQVDDLKAVLTCVKSIERMSGKTIVIGHGFGGRVAICTTAVDERIDGCVVWESIGDTREELEQKTSQLGWKLYNALWVKDVKGTDELIDKLTAAADVLNPVACIKNISPRPVLIIHRKGDPMVTIEHAYMLEKNALEPKTLILANGWMHSDNDSFFTSYTRKDGAITYTNNWIQKYIIS